MNISEDFYKKTDKMKCPYCNKKNLSFLYDIDKTTMNCCNPNCPISQRIQFRLPHHDDPEFPKILKEETYLHRIYTKKKKLELDIDKYEEIVKLFENIYDLKSEEYQKLIKKRIKWLKITLKRELKITKEDFLLVSIEEMIEKIGLKENYDLKPVDTSKSEILNQKTLF